MGGGETPSLGDIVAPDAIDLAGAAVGIIRPKERLVTQAGIRSGDAIVLIGSTGIHANGLSLARRVAADLPQGYLAPLSDGRSYGEGLLIPSPLYSNLVRDIQQAGVDIHYMVHITGHGWRKLMRAERELSYVIELVPDIPPVVEFVCQEAHLSDEEAYGTFNMGAGFAFYVSQEQAQSVVKIAHAHGMKALVAGHIEEGPRRVLIQPKGIEYHGEALQIR